MADTPSSAAPTKSIFTSKTAIINVLIALGTAYPPVGQWVKDNPQLALYILGAINFILRTLTKHRVVLWNSDSAS